MMYDITSWSTGRVFCRNRPYAQACRIAAWLRHYGRKHICVVSQETGRAVSEVIR